MPIQPGNAEVSLLARAPAEFIPQDFESTADGREPKGPKEGVALCLSGGGYRAMLFHVGALWRLNELGLLRKLDRVSSVSGGSITAAVLALAWKELNFDGRGVSPVFGEKIVSPLRVFSENTIDWKAVAMGLLPLTSVGMQMTAAYNKHLFHGKTLQDFPSDPEEGPRFLINATSVQSGVLFRFTKRYAADWRVGRIPDPKFEVALAVAASSAFPPALSPLRVPVKESDFLPGSGDGLQRPPFTTELFLSDGGVYDNIGLETAWKEYRTIFVSDAGAALAPEGKPDITWPFHTYRVLNVIDRQVRNLRVRQAIGSYYLPEQDTFFRRGAYWSIRPQELKDPPVGALRWTEKGATQLAEISTRLSALDEQTQERLINWGYAICDTRVRAHYDKSLPAPRGYPYPDRGV